MGKEAVIERVPDGNSDRLNHNTGEYEPIGTEICAYYNPDTEGGQSASGEVSITQSQFAFFPDASIRVNDHIIYDLVTYEVEKVTHRPSHTVAVAKQVQ
jgi:hypothetical protein